MQWKNEIAAHTEGLKVLVWHGSSRESNCEELQKYDVVCLSKLVDDQFDRYNLTKVLTTYSVMERYAYLCKSHFGFSPRHSSVVFESNKVVSSARA